MTQNRSVTGPLAAKLKVGGAIIQTGHMTKSKSDRTVSNTCHIDKKRHIHQISGNNCHNDNNRHIGENRHNGPNRHIDDPDNQRQIGANCHIDKTHQIRHM